MAQSEDFRRLLTEGIYRVSACEAGKPIRVVQDELGYALGKRGGGSAVEYWRQGHPPKTADIEKLAREIIRRSDLDQSWLAPFLASAAYPHPAALCHELCPPASPARPANPTSAGAPLAMQLLPNQAYRVLVGRAPLLRDLLAALQDTQGRWVVTIDGIGGIGKTALAREAVALCEKRQWFDAILWISAAAGRAQPRVDASSGTLTFATLLDTVARYLGAPDLAQADLTEKRLRVQTLLRRQRVLLVLDNLESAAEPQAALVAQLQTLLNPSKALCTSRHRFTDDVYAVHLGGLATEVAVPFVRQEAQERRVVQVAAATDTLITQLVTITGGSPLALKLAVGQASYLPLPVIIQTLRAAGARSALPSVETGLYQALFGPVWEQLSTPARELLIALTTFAPGEGGALVALQVVSNLAEAVLLVSINELWLLSLLEVAEESVGAASGLRYFLHPLTYHFVVGKLDEFAQLPGNPALTPTAAADAVALSGCRDRMLRYLLAQIEQAAGLPPPEPVRRLAMYLLDGVLALPAHWPLASQLLVQLSPKMEQAGHRRDWLPYVEQGIEQSQALADARTTAELQLKAGMLYQLLGEYPTAERQLAASATGFAALSEPHNQARAINRRAYVHWLQRQPVAAARLAQTALALLAETDAERGSSYTVLGAVALDDQAGGRAVAYFRQALAYWQPTNNVPMIARRLRDLGVALRQADNYTEAISCYEQALHLFTEVQEPSQAAVVQMNLGNVYLQLGQPERALGLYRLAEPIFQQTCDEPQLTILYRNIGEAHAQLGLSAATSPLPNFSKQIDRMKG